MEHPSDRKSQRIFDSFFIVEWDSDGKSSRKHTFPRQSCDEKELQQCEKFCFPLCRSKLTVSGQKHQHFTFVLTDIDKNRKYGFCKLTDIGNRKQCYCFLGTFPWFEIFYKCLNCICTIHVRNDLATLRSIVEKLYKLPIPKPNDIITVSTSLTFSIPLDSLLPSIPENRNMMEYVSSINSKNMMEIFAALMFERRIIFTSSSLSALTGCIFAAESLLNPLTWQHIFIPVLHEYITDYCAAPMPFIIGVHSSVFVKIQDTAVTDGVVVVNIDTNTVDTPYDDMENMPSEAISFLRGQLGKPNIAVRTNLPEAFLKTQARIFGAYRSALKFRMGESIVFDEDKFIDLHKPGSRRSFAEELIKLQTFREFIDKRLHMLNNGIGFHDPFEKEVTELQREKDYTSAYKEWLAMRRKSTEFITNVKRQAKSNMKQARESAKQGMRDMKHAIKPVQKETTRGSNQIGRSQSLRENVTSMRPPRPPPPRFASSASSRTVTRFKIIEESPSEGNSVDDNELRRKNKPRDETEENEMLLIDLTPDDSVEPVWPSHVHETKYTDIFSTDANFSLLSFDDSGVASGRAPFPSAACEQEAHVMSLPSSCPHMAAENHFASHKTAVTDDLFNASDTVFGSSGESMRESAVCPDVLAHPLISFD